MRMWLLLPVLVVCTCLGDDPYPRSDLVDGWKLDWSTHQRHAQGSDNFQLTWADDGHLYGAWGDGGGFGGTNSKGRVGLGVARVEGGPRDYRGFNVWGGLEAEREATFDGKSWGLICVEEVLHMWVVPDRPDGKKHRNHYEYVELASSRDHGRSWEKADWRFLQEENLTIPTFLNFGRNNDGVPESYGDYVYSYFISPASITMEHQGPQGVGLVVHKPGKLYLARVETSLLGNSKQDFQFFCGLDGSRDPIWGALNDKVPVFEDSRGVGWCLSACYHPGIKRVLLTTEHGESKTGQLGLFEGATPWGPWKTVVYHDEEDPFGKTRTGSDHSWENNVFFMALPTKWLDDYDFTLTFTGAGSGRDNDSFNTVQGRFGIVED